MKMIIALVAVVSSFIKVTPAQPMAPFCKGRLIDKTCYGLSFFAATPEKVTTLDDTYPDIETDLRNALMCGKTCVDRTKQDCGQTIGSGATAQNRRCDINETFCYQLLASQDAALPPKYPPPQGTELSQPQCNQRLKEVKWIKVDGMYCKVVKKDQSRAHLKISDCSCKRCCVSPYMSIKKCLPNGFIPRTFCVYCPCEDSDSSSDEDRETLYADTKGDMRIVTRYMPSCCTCNTEWCYGW